MEVMPLAPVYSAMCLVSVITGAWAVWRVTERAAAGLASLAGLLAGWFLWYHSADVIRAMLGDPDWSWFLPFYSYNLEYHWLFTLFLAVAFVVGGIVWRVSHKGRHGLTALVVSAVLLGGLYAALGFGAPLAVHGSSVVREVRPSPGAPGADAVAWSELTPEERQEASAIMAERAYTPVWYRLDLQRFLVILGFAGLAFGISRNLPIAIFTAVGFLFLWNLGLWIETLQTLSIVVLATCISIVIGIPLGIAAALSRICRMIIMPVLDFMQTLPAFVYLIPVIPFFGLGATPAIFATFIFSVPPAIRLTALGIQQVPGELVEAADAFGSTTGQKLIKLQIPIAAPSIRAGINQTVLLALSMAVIAAMIGAPGLGSVVWTAIQRLLVGQGFEGGIGIVIVAMILDRILQQASSGAKAPPAQH
jgi:glycine betaine/proline transport system permease protein